MPRFFLHLLDGRRYPDHEGSLHDDLESAMEEARNAARGMMADSLAQGAPLPIEERIEIWDEAGTLCSVVTFREVAGLDAG